jgi:hypothetical protein
LVYPCMPVAKFPSELTNPWAKKYCFQDIRF